MEGADESIALVAMAGKLLRMMLALVAVVVLYNRGDFGALDFVIWLVVFYLVLLGVETVHLYRLMQRRK